MLEEVVNDFFVISAYSEKNSKKADVSVKNGSSTIYIYVLDAKVHINEHIFTGENKVDWTLFQTITVVLYINSIS